MSSTSARCFCWMDHREVYVEVDEVGCACKACTAVSGATFTAQLETSTSGASAIGLITGIHPRFPRSPHWDWELRRHETCTQSLSQKKDPQRPAVHVFSPWFTCFPLFYMMRMHGQNGHNYKEHKVKIAVTATPGYHFTPHQRKGLPSQYPESEACML